jgi:hypothetical protein
MITPPLSISARPVLTLIVPISGICVMLAVGLRLAVLGFLFLGLFLGNNRKDVRLGRGEELALAVLELDDDDRASLLADDQLMGVDDGALFVVLAILGARGEHTVADSVEKSAHGAKYASA